MKRDTALTIVVFASAALVQIVSAGTEPVSGKEMKEVAPAPPPCDWNGFYLGGHIGFGGGDLIWRDVDFGDNEILTHQVPIGVFGGGQLGYNHQFGSWFVAGIEGAFAYSDIHHKSVKTEPNDDKNTFDDDNNWTATAALRGGFTSLNNHLWTYAKGGVVWSHWEYDWTHDETAGGGNVDRFSHDETRVAPMLGFGMEYAINCRWSVKLEYQHLFLGSADISGRRLDDGVFENEHYRIDLATQDSVQAGINYKFWSF